jgi:hypothetical protein
MKSRIGILGLSTSFLAAACMSSYASVSLSTDSSVTLGSSTSWSGSPALSMLNPNQNTSVDGNITDGVFFKPGSSFTLGAFEFYGANGGTGSSSIGTYNLSLYDLGSSYTIPANNPIYTFSGSELNLFSPGLNFTTTANNQFNVLSFLDTDQVSLNAGDTYILAFSKASGDNLIFARGGPTANQALGVGTTAPGVAGTALNDVPAGQRTPVAAFYAASPVPEPSTFALVGMGAAALLTLRRRRA